MDVIGLIEVIGYVVVIEVFDVCLKFVNVNIVRVDKVGVGIVILIICGDVGVVKVVLEVGEIVVFRVGILRILYIILRIYNEVINVLFKIKEFKVCEVLEDKEKNFEIILEIVDNVLKNLLEKENVILDVNENSGDIENLYSDIDKINKKIEIVDDSLIEVNEEKIENINDKEVLE